ncbi:lactonase family protein [Planococcus sp. ISL-109]|uniref:lactonase family protein n=1 Tax=Planococcus sp. ISL-109 TaxID=2819166 RepID=UPI001BE9D01C|nr:lactonase family protein [Planococcus sp. ISL-109]MBT2581444.1 lactonase family protein [Planococcus sp. ISL-109]
MSSAYILSGSYATAEQAGITLWELELSSGKLTEKAAISGVERPSFLAVHPTGRSFVAVSETGNGEVIAYWINPQSGVIQELNRKSSNGDHPAHVAIDEDGQWALTVTYSGATVSVYPLLADGSLGEMADVKRHEGSGADAARQDAAHPHSIFQLPGTNRFFVSDLGMDALIRYRLDMHTGVLEREELVKTAPGAGPRHMAFHPTAPFGYGVNELNSTVSVYALKDKQLQEVQTLSTLPKDYNGDNTAAEIAVSSDGRFVYASNRGHDSLAVFRIEDGSLKAVGHADAGGAGPRHFTLINNSSWLVVAHEKSGTISTKKIDERGMPGETAHTVQTTEPVCVRPLKY